MRIVSLLPSATEIVYALGLGDALAGVTHECDYPAAARRKPVLTRSHVVAEPRAGETLAAAIDRQVTASLHDGHSLYDIDGEQLAALRPDLILTQELCDVCAVSSRLLRATLDRIGLAPVILSLQPASLDEMYANIMEVGAATGATARADAVVDGLRARAHALQQRTNGFAHPRTLVLEWTDPPMGSGHWTPHLVTIAGGTPVLGWDGEYSRVIGWDEIAAADPECIIVAPCGMDLVTTRSSIADLDRSSDAWRALRADPRRRVVAIDGHQFVNRPGPRLIDTAELFAEAIHPGLVGQPAMPAAQREAILAPIGA